MTFAAVLSNLTIGPLKLLFDVIFSLANRVFSTGISIVILSLAVNIMVLPLYRRADELQKRQREEEDRLSPDIRHIKHTFHGDEQVMILQKYYQRNHYSPLHALRGALPLLLQIPFFIAAYQFLIRQGCLQGASFGPIHNLGEQDGLLRFGEISLNLLPILMTVINLLSGMLYLRKGFLKEKIQLAGMALIFLVLLYRSPAGLTLYWTLNNLFSLGKNVLRKIWPSQRQKHHISSSALRGSPRQSMFFIIAVCLAVLTGMLIPSAVLSASPQEFIDYAASPNPIWYIINALLLATGTFVLWAGIYYLLANPAVKRGMEMGAWALLGISIVNYLFFRNNFGTMSSTLKYAVTPSFTTAQKLINLGILTGTTIVLLIVSIRKETFVKWAAGTIAVTMIGMSVHNVWIIRKETLNTYENKFRNYQGNAEIPLSTDGKNVIVFMLDRAINSFVPCIMYEKPELKDVYSGFVYYPNTLSFSPQTNTGAPALFGGYEYSPWAINARDQELLRDKHNEALLLMPTLFGEEGYRISVFDMPYPGDYSNTGDYSLYDEIPNTNARALAGSIRSDQEWDWPENERLRNFFCHSISMTVPSFMYGLVYNLGNYNATDDSASLFTMSGADIANYNHGSADRTFMIQYEVLTALKEMTTISQNDENTLLLIANKTTHEPVLLPEPEYAPVRGIQGNEEYDEVHMDRFLAGPIPLEVDNEDRDYFQMRHYDVNMAALLTIGDWLTWLKEMGVYDNTRIIIVADHGVNLKQIRQGELENDRDITEYNPLLMVKDFDAQGQIATDTSFMTNADVPTLAMAGIIDDPVNPFTGNAVNSEKKDEISYVTHSRLWQVGPDAGTKFTASSWYAVEPGGDTLFDPSRWTYLPEEK